MPRKSRGRHKPITRKPSLDWKAIFKRIDEIADVLEIPEAEVKAAKASVIAPNRGVLPLVQFVRKYSQCLNWIMCGCPRSMIRQLAGRPQDVPVEPGDLPYEPTPTLH